MAAADPARLKSAWIPVSAAFFAGSLWPLVRVPRASRIRTKEEGNSTIKGSQIKEN